MSRDFEAESGRISSVDDLIQVFRDGEKPRDAFRIGAEYEKLAYWLRDGGPVQYEGGIDALLEGLTRYGWKPTGGEPIVALERDGASVSLEPGGQFELSGAPQSSIHDVARELARHVAELVELGKGLGIGFSTLGFRPFQRTEDMPWMPKDRYRIMREHLGSRGSGGLEMMLLSATVQANLDFCSESDMARKMRASMGVSPVIAAMFANSPFEFGAWGGQRTRRYAMWRNVDRARTGLLPFVFADDFGYRHYLEWALDVPMFFLRRDGSYLPVEGLTFRQYMEQGFHGEQANITDFENHLSALFPEVRLKRFVEVRCGDSVPVPLALAMVALWKGLLYDEETLGAVTKLMAGFSMPEREAMQIAAARDGLRGRAPTFDLGDLASEVLRLGAQGLKRLGIRDAKGRDESHFLQPLEPIVASRTTRADQAVVAFGSGPWDQETRLRILGEGAYDLAPDDYLAFYR
ncbi:MAG TPA: glutamate-cysteine ligase family protein [Myxococcota bacterium]|nr:glutamate-cysteine ligase family protein [Myxococcota bacterium]